MGLTVVYYKITGSYYTLLTSGKDGLLKLINLFYRLIFIIQKNIFNLNK